MIFTDRVQAGHHLAKALSSYQGDHPLIIGLARGGVVVANAVASDLSLPVDVLVVKKIPAIGNPEFALGALAPDGISIINWRLAQRVGADERYMNTQLKELQEYIRQKTLHYRKKKKPLMVRDKTVILVDDGAATGSTLEAAIKWCKAKKAKKIIAAVPVAHPETVAKITPEADAFIVLNQPREFSSVGQFYREFPQLSDENVVELLA